MAATLLERTSALGDSHVKGAPLAREKRPRQQSVELDPATSRVDVPHRDRRSSPSQRSSSDRPSQNTLFSSSTFLGAKAEPSSYFLTPINAWVLLQSSVRELPTYYPLEKKHHSTKKGDYGNRNTLKELPVCRNYPMAPVQEYYRKPVRNYELSLVRMALVCRHLHTPPALFQGGWGAWVGSGWPMTCHCTRLNDSRAHTTAHARTEESPPREHRLQSHQPRHTHERAQHHQVPCMLPAGAKGLVT